MILASTEVPPPLAATQQWCGRKRAVGLIMFAAPSSLNSVGLLRWLALPSLPPSQQHNSTLQEIKHHLVSCTLLSHPEGLASPLLHTWRATRKNHVSILTTWLCCRAQNHFGHLQTMHVSCLGKRENCNFGHVRARETWHTNTQVCSSARLTICHEPWSCSATNTSSYPATPIPQAASGLTKGPNAGCI